MSSPTVPGYTVLRWSQHWRIIGGAVYRDALARRHADGCLREISVIDDGGEL